MKIDVTFDSSVTSSKYAAGIEACAEGVAKFYETQFNNPITITWDVGWGEVDGQGIPSGGGAESISNYSDYYTYAQVRGAFAAVATTADDKTALATLPTTDPTSGGTFSMTTAEAKALGLADPGAPSIDGYSGLDSTSTWIFNTTNTNGSDVPAGDLDAFSFLAHELSEVMGRQQNYGVNYGGGPGDGSGYYPYDLFDYTASGVRDLTNPDKAGRYASINGGVTPLHYLNTDASEGDPFDWLPSTPADSYDWEGSIGAVSAMDLRIMNILGYDPTPNFTTTSLSEKGAAFSFKVNNTSEGAGAASTTGIYLSKTSTISTADTLLKTVATPAVAAGATASLSAALTFSTSLAPGDYWVGAIADYNGAVTEPESADSVSNSVPIVIVGASNMSTISGKAGVDAFDPGSASSSATFALDGALTVTGSLTNSAALGGSGTLALAGGTAAFDKGSSLAVADVSQSGTETAIFGVDITYAGVWSQAAGTVSVASGDRINFSGKGDVFSGTLAGAGIVAFTGGSDTLSGTTISATSAIINGPSVTLDKTITLDHQLTVATANLIVGAAGATLAGGGLVELTDSASNRLYGASDATTLTNDERIEGAGLIGDGVMKLVNGASGIIVGDDSVALTIDTGSNAIVNAGAIWATDTGGALIESAIDNTGTFDVTAGTLTADGAVTGAGFVRIGGGAAKFASTFAENVSFTGASGELQLARSQTYTGIISGFSKTGGTSLDLQDIAFVSASEATFAANVLTVTDGTHTARIHLAGTFTGSFVASSDGHGGTIVKDPTHAQALGAFTSAMSAFTPSSTGAPPSVANSSSVTLHALVATPRFSQQA